MELLYNTQEAARAAGCPAHQLPYPNLPQPARGVTEADYVGGLQGHGLPARPPVCPQQPPPALKLTQDQLERAISNKIEAQYKRSIRLATAKEKDMKGSLAALHAAGDAEAQLEQLLGWRMRVCDG